MGFDFIRRAVDDVYVSAIGLPAGYSGRVPLVGVGDATVMLLFEFILDGIGSGVAAQPKLFDKLLALFVVIQTIESSAFLAGQDICDVLVRPAGVTRLQLLAELVLLPALARSHDTQGETTDP